METGWKGLMLSCGLAVCASTLVSAQSFEIGGAVGTVSGTLYSIPFRPIGGVQVSGWWADRFEAGFRMAWQRMPDVTGGATYYYGCEVDARTGRCYPTGSLRIINRSVSPRQFTAGQGLYHFRRGRFIRPFVGAGVGTFRHTELIVCEVPGCEGVLPGLHLGRRTTSHADFIGILGASTALESKVVIRGGLQFHNLVWQEELSLLEMSVGFGYRF